MLYIGLMSGTSMDAVDAVLVDFNGRDIRVAAYEQTALPADLRDKLRRITPASPLSEVADMDARLGMLFADAALRVISRAARAPSDIAAIGSHGQTVFHSPGSVPATTLQIGDANRIAELTGITTVADLRRMDIAAGGQGAPLAPAFHQWIFRDPGINRVVINIGGIANASILPADPAVPVTGFDTGPGNTLLDRWIGRHRQQLMDRDGQWANEGRVSESLLARLLADPYFEAPPPKSTGPEYFNLEWLDRVIMPAGEKHAAADVQATLCELTCRSIARALAAHAPGTSEVLLCGGGVENPVLVAGLRRTLAPAVVQSTAKYGVNPHAVEALMCAWLAQQRMEMRAGNLPAVTGARQAVALGAVYLPASRLRQG